MGGLIEAFKPDDRVEITVSQLITLIEAKAKSEAAFYNAMEMLKAGVTADVILKVFGYREELKKDGAK
jgi:hypothetical protein